MATVEEQNAAIKEAVRKAGYSWERFKSFDVESQQTILAQRGAIKGRPVNEFFLKRGARNFANAFTSRDLNVEGGDSGANVIPTTTAFGSPINQQPLTPASAQQQITPTPGAPEGAGMPPSGMQAKLEPGYQPQQAAEDGYEDISEGFTGSDGTVGDLLPEEFSETDLEGEFPEDTERRLAQAYYLTGLGLKQYQSGVGKYSPLEKYGGLLTAASGLSRFSKTDPDSIWAKMAPAMAVMGTIVNMMGQEQTLKAERNQRKQFVNNLTRAITFADSI